VSVVAVDEVAGSEELGPMTGRRDDEVNVDLRARDRLEGFLDQSGEAILQPVLGELAGHSDPERIAVGRYDRRVFEPHVVRPLGELEA